MRQEIAEAIENARTISLESGLPTAIPKKGMSFNRARLIVLSVLRDCPEGMKVSELRDEIEIYEIEGFGGKDA